MHTHTDDTQENKAQSVANVIFKESSSDGSASQFVDNRHETMVQRKLQKIANNSDQVKQTTQLQSMADDSPVVQAYKQPVIHPAPAHEKAITSPGSFSHFVSEITVQRQPVDVVQMMSELDTETRRLAREEVEAGRYHAAALWIFYKYGFNTKYPHAKIVDPVSGLSHHESGDAVFAATTGPSEKNAEQTITFNQEKFAELVLSDEESDWAYLISAMGHECEHSAQRSGTDETSHNRVVNDAEEAEFLSYSWEAMGLSPGPSLSEEQLVDKARKAIQYWHKFNHVVEEYDIEISDKLQREYHIIALECQKIMKANQKIIADRAEALARKERIRIETEQEIAAGIRFPNGFLKSYGTFD